jgi:integrase
MALNDAKIRAAKPGPKIKKLSDGDGLQLWLMPDGKKYWRLAYRFGGKQKVLAIGVYDRIGLKQARDERTKARAILDAGQDPLVARKVDKATKAIAAANTFDAVAEELFQKKRREEKAEKTLVKFEWFSRLARPILGHRPISEITAAEVLAVLQPIDQRGRHETAKKLRGFIGQVFRYAIATKRCENDPTGGLRGALTVPRVQHRAAITDERGFGALLGAIEGYQGQPETRIALELLALSFVRPGELRSAAWDEFDLEKAVWSIPAGRMKMKRAHRVPLAPQAVALLEELRSISLGRGPLLFPGQRSAERPISENTFNAALRRLGYGKEEVTAHGFRATACSMLNESGLWSVDAIERQLAHVESNNVRRAYARADYWDERVRMMAWWADRCDEIRRDALSRREPPIYRPEARK